MGRKISKDNRAEKQALEELTKKETDKLNDAILALGEIEAGRNILLGLHEISRDVMKLDLGYMPQFQALVEVMASGVINGTVRMNLELAAIQIRAGSKPKEGQ